MLDISKIRAITLDLDDTLWPIWPAIARAELALSGWLLNQAPGAAAVFADPIARVALRQAVDQNNPHFGHDLSAFRREMIRLALHRAQEDTALAEPAFEVFFDARMQVDLFEDARPALAFLAARYPIVALSNGNADVGRVGLGEFFEASVSAQAFGVPTDAVLHIGDDAALDVLGALGVGMQTVWVSRDAKPWAHEAQPHLSVASLHELCALLEAVPPRLQV